MTNEILKLIILLILSGFFSSSETALFSISRIRARINAEKGDRFDKLIKKMKDDTHKLLFTILIGNNVVNVAAAALATSIAIDIFSNNVVGIVTGIMTLTILVFGEIIPKSLATQHNITISRIVIYPLYWLSILFYPLIFFLNIIPKITGRKNKTPIITEEELKIIVEFGEEEGEIKKEEKILIHNIFRFDEIKVSEIMTPRADMFTIDINKNIKSQISKIINSGFTRIPVIDKGVDQIIGIINVKELLKPFNSGKKDLDIKKIMRNPHFVPENKNLDTLLHLFKKRKEHMALVVDEYGSISGLITLEDVLEEIVGEIIDETDRIEPKIIKTKEKGWRIKGKTDISEVNKKVGMKIPVSNSYDTLSGYILEKIGKIPKKGDTVVIEKFKIIVKSLEGNRIKELIVKKKS